MIVTLNLIFKGFLPGDMIFVVSLLLLSFVYDKIFYMKNENINKNC